MSRSDRLHERIRITSGKYLGRPSLCNYEPGKKMCLKQLRSPNPGVCINCQVEEVLTERIKVLGG